MRASRLWYLACLPLVVAACGGGDEEETAATADTGAVTTAPAPAPMDTGGMAAGMDTGMAAAGGMNSVTLSPVGNSGVSGTATVTEQGAQTVVALNLMGAPGAGTHAAHIHTGTCDSPGAVVAPLQSVSVDASGTGTSTTTLDIPMATVMNGQHIVAAHEAGGSPGSPVVCGAIPAHSM